jgi:hypothetical protein
MERAVILYSSLSTDQIQIVNTRRLEDAVLGKKLAHNKIDGASPENKDIRDKLFGISGQRGKYPQFFIATETEDYRFVGLWEEIESLLDCDSLPEDVLAGNPNIPTFSKVRKFIVTWVR